MKYFYLSIILSSQILLMKAQELQIEPYLFLSNQKDSVEAELGTFLVPENRNKNNEKTLKLQFVRFKSTSENPGAPIVYLAGGPGGSGIGTARGRRFELFMKLREVADVIAFDQRGTGLSKSIPNYEAKLRFDPGRPVERSEYVEKILKTWKEAKSFFEAKGADISAYNTKESARDIEDLRKALGVEKISLWGISYGSHLAFNYIKNFEKRVDKVVLASLEGPDETIKLPSNTDLFVRQICERAVHNYGREPKYPDLWNTIQSVHAQVKSNPPTIEFTNRFGNPQKISISYFEFQLIMASFYLRDPTDSKVLPALYTKMNNGDYSDLAENASIIKFFMFRTLRLMPMAMDLASGITEERSQQIDDELEESLYGTALSFIFFDLMKEMDFPFLPDSFRTLPENEVEALLLSGTMDGRTYIQAAKEIAKAFKNGKHIIIENAGHNLYMQSPVIRDLVVSYFKGEELNIERLELEPIPFE